jgi:hypothetical protein
MLEPRCLTNLWASIACYRDSFTFFTSYIGQPVASMVQLLSDSSKALALTYQHPRETINLNTHYHENLNSQAKMLCLIVTIAKLQQHKHVIKRTNRVWNLCQTAGEWRYNLIYLIYFNCFQLHKKHKPEIFIVASQYQILHHRFPTIYQYFNWKLVTE